MWINVIDEPIYTYGKHGEHFLLHLKYRRYYGHAVTTKDEYEIVTALWDSVNECFF